MPTAQAVTDQAPARSQRTWRSDRRMAFVFQSVPFALIVLSYAWLAFDRGTLFLWNVLIHESGRYTLGETAFYSQHFLREIPTDLAYGLFLVSYFVRARGLPRTANRRFRPSVLAGIGLVSALVIASAAFASAAAQEGLQGAFRDLAQYRTRDDLSAYGSHWHFHWLSTIWFGAAASIVAWMLVPSESTRRGAGVQGWVVLMPWLYVGAVTLVFGLSSETFTDVRFAGHQAREILTHGPITLLLGMGVLLIVSNNRSRPSSSAASPGTASRIGLGIAAAGLFAIPVFLAVVTLSGDFMEAGQSDEGLAAMVAGHVFEHVLDYAFVCLVAVGLYGLAGVWSAREESPVPGE